jgi:acyl-CoA thioesterase I
VSPRCAVRLLVLVAIGWRVVRWTRVATSVRPYRRHWERPAVQWPQTLRYAALGDSLAQGIGASHPDRGYVGLLASWLGRATGRPVEVVNLGVTGIMVHDLLRDQVPALLAMDPPPELVTVTVGTNDAGRLAESDLRGRFDELCRRLPPGALVGDVPRFHRGRRAARARRAAAVLREVLAEHPHLVAVGLDEPTRAAGWRLRAADFFHPNDIGHRLYADAFWAAISKDA